MARRTAASQLAETPEQDAAEAEALDAEQAELDAQATEAEATELVDQGEETSEAEGEATPDQTEAEAAAPSPFRRVEAPEKKSAAQFVPDAELVEILNESFDSEAWFSVGATHYGATMARTVQYLRKSASYLGLGLAVKEYADEVSFQARVKKNFS